MKIYLYLLGFIAICYQLAMFIAGITYYYRETKNLTKPYVMKKETDKSKVTDVIRAVVFLSFLVLNFLV